VTRDSTITLLLARLRRHSLPHTVSLQIPDHPDRHRPLAIPGARRGDAHGRPPAAPDPAGTDAEGIALRPEVPGPGFVAF
jgi:hypothetical protein